MGRMFATGPTVQTVDRNARGYLFSDTKDLDMANCQARIVLWLTKLLRLQAPCLQSYVEHRDEILSRYKAHLLHADAKADVTDLKKHFSACMNRGGPSPDMSDFRELVDFQAEMMYLQREIFRHDDRGNDATNHMNCIEARTSLPANEFVKFQARQAMLVARQGHADDENYQNLAGSAMSWLVGDYENYILFTARHACANRGFKIAGLMFDGLILYPPLPSDEELINVVTEAVNRDWPMLNMQWKIKPHETTFRTPEIFTRGIVDELGAAEWIVRHYAHNFKVVGETIYCRKLKTGLWLRAEKGDDALLLQELMYLVSQAGLMRFAMPGAKCAKPTTFGREHNEQLPTAKQALMLLRNMTSNADAWARTEMITSGQHFLKFPNGVWDFRRGEFIEGDTDKVFFAQTPFPYEVVDEEYLDSVWKRFFVDPFSDPLVGVYLAQVLCRGLSGVPQKLVVCITGATDTGKSTLFLALQTAGGDYTGSWSAGDLHRSKNSSNDEASKWRFLLQNRFVRWFAASEISTDRPMDLQMFKSQTSGGSDVIAGRDLHKSEVRFRFQGLSIIFANDLPVIPMIDDAGVGRTKEVRCDVTFSDNPGPNELPKDPELVNEIQTSRFGNAFLQVIFRNYVLDTASIQPPDGVNVDPELEVADRRRLEWTEQFEQIFEITGNRELDRVQKTTMRTICEARGLQWNKINQQMNNRYGHLGVKEIKTNGGVMHWTGIRVKDQEPHA